MVPPPGTRFSHIISHLLMIGWSWPGIFNPRNEEKMKSLELLMNSVLVDFGTRCCTSTHLDRKTIEERAKHEGISFYTISLPNFAKDFESCLEQKAVDPNLFQGFRRGKGSCLPAFLQGFTGQVFDTGTGNLLNEVNVNAVLAVRQICYLFQKLELPCSEKRTEEAFTNYIKTEATIRQFEHPTDSPLISDFRRISRLLFGDLFSNIDRQIYEGNLIPRHGPGATADKLVGNDKFKSKVWTERLEEVFPAMDYLYSSPRHFFNSIEDNEGPVWLEPGSEIPVKVITVPKTLKTPRIIAIEPSYMQYVQQAIMHEFVSGIERDDNFLGSFIGFTDQTVNRDLAKQGSKQGDLATLDLSEASDRVSIQHVDELTADFAWLNQAVFACRSSKAEVPGHGEISLFKYASMGSALTFPLEAMVFLTIVFIGIEQALSCQLTRQDIISQLGQVRVYGDDIIVPVEYVRHVCAALYSFGMKVNRNKSFWNGSFRESCGGDYFEGHDITVVKVRKVPPSKREQVQETVSAVSSRNQFYLSGLWNTAALMDTWIRDVIPFPNTHETSPGLGRYSHLGYDTERECPRLQRPLVRAAVIRSRIPESNLSGPDALLKCLLKRGDKPFADSEHLRRAGRPDAVDIKLRWIQPY